MASTDMIPVPDGFSADMPVRCTGRGICPSGKGWVQICAYSFDDPVQWLVTSRNEVIVCAEPMCNDLLLQWCNSP